MICSLFQLHIAGQSSEIEKKYPHVVVKSITTFAGQITNVGYVELKFGE